MGVWKRCKHSAIASGEDRTALRSKQWECRDPSTARDGSLGSPFCFAQDDRSLLGWAEGRGRLSPT